MKSVEPFLNFLKYAWTHFKFHDGTVYIPDAKRRIYDSFLEELALPFEDYTNFDEILTFLRLQRNGPPTVSKEQYYRWLLADFKQVLREAEPAEDTLDNDDSDFEYTEDADDEFERASRFDRHPDVPVRHRDASPVRELVPVPLQKSSASYDSEDDATPNEPEDSAELSDEQPCLMQRYRNSHAQNFAAFCANIHRPLMQTIVVALGCLHSATCEEMARFITQYMNRPCTAQHVSSRTYQDRFKINGYNVLIHRLFVHPETEDYIVRSQFGGRSRQGMRGFNYTLSPLGLHMYNELLNPIPNH